jgi:Flp pilus assembly protein TadG
MVPLMALFFVVLIGAMAIATDLSVSTHYKRNVQNVTDAAALAGAKLLPATPGLSDEQAATSAALTLVHNSFPWTPNGVGWATNLANSGCSGAQCSVTVCTAGMASAIPACTPGPGVSTVTSTTGAQFALTVNAPPKTALVQSFNSTSDTRRIEVVMHQKSGAFFTGLFGSSLDQDGAQSIAYHFAANQPFGFALYSRTYVADGNSPELINGNIYAARYLTPQSDGKSSICAAPDSSGNPGYIVLGSPQGTDPGYQNDGQSNDQSNVLKAADPIVDNVSCSIANPLPGGVVGMSAPGSLASCQSLDPSYLSLVYDNTDHACEANPPIAPPAVEQPSIPSLLTEPTYCGSSGLGVVGGVLEYRPGYYNDGICGTSLNVDETHLMAPGIYEIEANAPKSACGDVVIAPKANINLTGVTFYLMHGATMCVNPPVGVTINQTPFCGSCASPPVAAGDGIYDVLSDNSGNPTINMATAGGGSGAGIWQLSGVIWLPTGTVNINNADALVDSGQVIVNTWNDQSGNHPNPSVSYSPSNSGPQFEKLQLSE